ncbi:hypothetical protein [Aliirhizobium smilacinae]|uniref:Uncharacterized protein n=1 Tax=Aliirhizobium smilacinae TaxID=1395944 RepID=A0A5C4X862_9HYPH|nr:hypothetical protein [Rhizobium smilacinae]TNM59582.1 hypothetical protein FHP24_28110 [Rhizobium smilacinae]
MIGIGGLWNGEAANADRDAHSVNFHENIIVNYRNMEIGVAPPGEFALSTYKSVMGVRKYLGVYPKLYVGFTLYSVQ